MKTLQKSLTLLLLCAAFVHVVNSSSYQDNGDMLQQMNHFGTVLNNVKDSLILLAGEIVKAFKGFVVPKTIDGRWTDWSRWSPCSDACNGISTRKRGCIEPIYGGKPCQGKENETQECGGKCPAAGEWTAWSRWSPCSDACKGTSTRMRSCYNPNNEEMPCQGKEKKTQECDGKCPGRRHIAVAYVPEDLELRSTYKSRWKIGKYRLVLVKDTGLNATATFRELEESLNHVFRNTEEIDEMLQFGGYSMNDDQAVQVIASSSSVPGANRYTRYCDANGYRYDDSELDRWGWVTIHKDDGKALEIRNGYCWTVIFVNVGQ